MKAREVIAGEIGSYDPDYETKQDAAERMIDLLSKAGFVILPKEPSEGMIEAAFKELFEPESSVSRVEMENIYGAMIFHAEGEKG